MEFELKLIKFMARPYIEDSQKNKLRSASPYKRHKSAHRGYFGKETNAASFFPDIFSGRQCRSLGYQEGRLPMIIVDSPGPAAYYPPSVNLRESRAPSYTFGWKTPPKEGGGRRAWQKSWFQSKNPFIRKVDYSTETNWPSPFQYGQPLGTRPANQTSVPYITIGQKGEFSLVNKGTEDNPAPNRYNTDFAYKQVLQRAPSIIINPAPQTMYRWASKEGTPGPATYNVERGYLARLPTCPSFYIQGVRRPKLHETGPFSTL